MGDYHQDLVVKNASNEDLENIIGSAIDFLTKSKIISTKQSDNVLGSDLGYCPGGNWKHAVDYPEEGHFLELKTNGLEIRKGRTVFHADGQDFESINCPSCGGNNVECDWGELFGLWIDDPDSANLKCAKCGESNSISEYQFDPVWALSNLGFVFWNWPILSSSFITEFEKVLGKKIVKVEGKL